MQNNQEILVAATLSQYTIDQGILPQAVLNSIYAVPTDLVTAADMMDYQQKIGSIINQSERSAELQELLDEEVHIIIHKLKFIDAQDRPKVIVLDSLNPTVINQNAYLHESIKIAGGIPTTVIAEADKLIIINDEDLTLSQIPSLLSDINWSTTRAIQLNQVFLINKDHFGKIPGKDYTLELETFAEILQPKYFFYGLEGDTWIQFQLV